jgi:signal transduction histidine kinase
VTVETATDRERGIRARIGRLGPRSFQARLTLALVGVVALTLILVSYLVINRLDDYFTQQQRTELLERSRTVAGYVDVVAADAANGAPVVNAKNDTDTAVVVALSSPRQQRAIANILAQADVKIVLGHEVPGTDMVEMAPSPNGVFHAELTSEPAEGQTQESLVVSPYRVRSTMSAYPYLIEVQLSDPYTFRQTALANVTGLLAAVGIVALGIAIIIAAGLALRFTTPLRRLTEAARSLAEGELGSRVPAAQVKTGTTELTELAEQFNTMAEQLEESVSIIRRDRDRSRDFLADVSHELRTPIAALLTFNELLSEGASDDPVARAEFLAASRQQLERLDWLAQNLLELSKLDSGLVLLDLRPDDLRAAVESAFHQSDAAARRRGVTMSLSLPDSPVRIRHDPQRIGQVVTNLVGNAVKFTPPGGTISIRVSPYADGALIEVADTGVGIPASEMTHIFDRFYRGSQANEARGSGSGLGLAIVRSIVDMHHGRINVDSTLGNGSRFTVILPRDPRVDEASEPPASEPVAPVSGVNAAEPPKVADSSPSAAPSLNRESSG